MIPNRKQTLNAMSIDVEDYFQVAAFKSTINPNDWDNFACRVENNTNKVLSILDSAQVKATFFTLGWVAQRYPSLIRQIVANGHELASHGYGHQMITNLSPESFRQDVIRAKKLLEDTGGKLIQGYRAPSFSIGRSTLWAHEILTKTGHVYSSSIYPIKHDLYGMPEAPRFAHRRPCGILEIPATSTHVGNKNLPASGGGFFRLLPLLVSKAIINRVNKKDNQAAIFYCHPWEFDPDQPRIEDASAKSKFRHYVNLEQNSIKFELLLKSFRWAPMNRVFGSLLE
jgi:polysaccharide deacetylase family protein (PEP-CTERM system associated)